MRKIEWKKQAYGMMYLFISDEMQSVKFSDMINPAQLSTATSEDFAQRFEEQLYIQLRSLLVENTDLTEDETEHALEQAAQIINTREQQ